MGLHVPVAKHSKVQFSWAATPTFCSAVSNGHSLPQLITDQNSPECPCARYLGSNATWPTVTVGGVRHIAASQASVPWPRGLRHVADWPASTNLPPRREDVICALRDSFKRFRKRCKVRSDGNALEDIVACTTSTLWLMVQRAASSCPLSWEDVALCRGFLKDFFVQYFDHNVSRIGVFCPLLVFRASCDLLDFGECAMASLLGRPRLTSPILLSAWPT